MRQMPWAVVILAFGAAGCGGSQVLRVSADPGAAQSSPAKRGSRAARPLSAAFDREGEMTRVLRRSDDSTEPSAHLDAEASADAAAAVRDDRRQVAHALREACTVGPSELDCVTKMHWAQLGTREAARDISERAAQPSSDRSSEISAADGNVIYRANLSGPESDGPRTNATAGLAPLAPVRAR
jgi:hypothetical protein